MKRNAAAKEEGGNIPSGPRTCFDVLLAACWRLSQLRYVFLIWAEKGNMNPNFEPVLKFCSGIISPWPIREKCIPDSGEILKKEKDLFSSLERHVSSFRQFEKRGEISLMADELVQVADFASSIRALCDPTFTPLSFLDVKASFLDDPDE